MANLQNQTQNDKNQSGSNLQGKEWKESGDNTKMSPKNTAEAGKQGQAGNSEKNKTGYRASDDDVDVGSDETSGRSRRV